VPLHDQPVALDDLTDRGGQHAPLLGDGQHGRQVLRRDDGQHPLLRLARQHLVRLHRGLAQRHAVQVREHPGPAGRGRLGQRAGQPGAAEVLDALDELRVVQLEAGLDEQLLGERVADLHRRPAGRAVRVEGGAGQHRDPADAVTAGLGTQQHDDVADAAGGGQLDALDRHDAEAEGVDQRVALVARVEDHLAADVGQAEAVPVAADPATIPGSTRAVSGWSASPKRSGSMIRIGRAPMVRMSRTMPPTPVAAPW
jgi:hypothetical protein